MSRLKLGLMLVMMTLVSVPALGGEAVVKRIPAGAVAFHFVFDLSYATGEFVGYVAFIEGVDGPLFDGGPSKDSAYFTVRVTKPVPPPVGLPVEPDPLPALNVSILAPSEQFPAGQFTIFFNPDPDSRDWNEPGTFSQGVPIAVFEESALLNTVASGSFGVFPGVSYSTFSSRLIHSAPINFYGQKVDFRKLVPNGVTVSNFGNGIRSTDYFGASGGGTALAIGGTLRDKSDD